MRYVFGSILEKFLVFLAVVVEVLLGGFLGYVILHVAYYLEVSVASMDDAAGSPVYYGAIAVEWLLLIGDVFIVVLFTADGVLRAFKGTFGKHEERTT